MTGDPTVTVGDGHWHSLNNTNTTMVRHTSNILWRVCLRQKKAAGRGSADAGALSRHGHTLAEALQNLSMKLTQGANSIR